MTLLYVLAYHSFDGTVDAFDGIAVWCVDGREAVADVALLEEFGYFVRAELRTVVGEDLLRVSVVVNYVGGELPGDGSDGGWS